MNNKELKVIRRNERRMDKNLLPLILLIILLINCLPLNLFNLFTKDSVGVPTIILAGCFLVQIALMLICLYKKVEFNKDFKIIVSCLVSITILLTMVQAYNLFKHDFYIMDLFNIGCKFVNIFLMVACIAGYKTKEEYIIFFMKGIVYFGLFSCLVNFFIYYKEILNILALRSASSVYIKSFFANRNQFAFFIFTFAVATLFVAVKEKNPLYFWVYLPIFILNMFFTASRTGIICLVIFLGLYLLFTTKISKRNKCIVIVLGIFLISLIGIFIYKENPKIISNILRLNEVKNFSGRTEIWERAFEALEGNSLNYIVGVGRFKGVTKLVFENSSFTQFHNTYLEFLVAGGLIELIGVLSIYLYIFYNIKKSCMSKEYKRIYLAMYITYFIYMLFESLGRFTLGASDTICLIFFVAIPLLHAKCIKISEGEEIKN